MDDLEQFWSNLLSEDAARIAGAWSTLDAEEREAIATHLRSIASDPERHPDQRRAAQMALSVPHPPPPTPPPSPDEKHQERGEGSDAGRGVGGEVVLASGSPRRRELVALLGLPFRITAAEIDETPQLGEAPAAMVTRLSREKARAARQSVQTTNPPTLLIAADTTVSLDGQVLGKPLDAAEARSMLTRLRGRSHQAFTAITLLDLGTGQMVTDLASTNVPMRNYSNEEMEAYIASGDPFDKAGGYAIQHSGFSPVAGMTGCYANVAGLPLCHVTRSLRALGVEPPVDVPAACQAHLGYECLVFQAILSEPSSFPR
jgi:MAF protein